MTVRSVPVAVVEALPGTSVTEKVPEGAMVTLPSAVGVTEMVQVASVQLMSLIAPLVTVKSEALTDAEASASFEVRVKRMGDPRVGSDWLAPCCRLSEGATVSTVHVRLTVWVLPTASVAVTA